MKLTEIAKAISPNSKIKYIGIRPGEKIHEQMIAKEEADYTYEYADYYKILPQINNWNKDKKRISNGKKVNKDFSYTSNNNKKWMSIEELQKFLKNA